MSEDKAKMNSLLKEDSMLKIKEKEAAKQQHMAMQKKKEEQKPTELILFEIGEQIRSLDYLFKTLKVSSNFLINPRPQKIGMISDLKFIDDDKT